MEDTRLLSRLCWIRFHGRKRDIHNAFLTCNYPDCSRWKRVIYIFIYIYIYEYTRNRNGFRNGHFLLRSIPTRRMIVCFPRTIYRGNDRLIPCTLSFSYYCTVAVDALHFISNLFRWNKRGTRSATVVVLPLSRGGRFIYHISRRPTWWQEWGIISVTKLIKRGGGIACRDESRARFDTG